MYTKTTNDLLSNRSTMAAASASAIKPSIAKLLLIQTADPLHFHELRSNPAATIYPNLNVTIHSLRRLLFFT